MPPVLDLDTPAAAGPPSRRALLADGSPLRVETLGPPDAAAVLQLHARLSDGDRFLRFGTLHPADLEDYVRRTLSGDRGELTVGGHLRGRLVGVVQVLPAGAGTAEVAVVVDAADRAHGVATALLEAAAALSRRRGVDRFIALVLAQNGRMLRVLTDLGLPLGVTREGTALRVEILLHPDERYARAGEERLRRAAAAGLDAVLRPASVAVVGAGRRQRSVGRLALRSIVAAGYRGTISVVHPEAGELDGIACVPSLSHLPTAPDLVVVAVPAAAVADVVRESGRCGARAVLILSSGIGAVPAQRLRETAVASGLRIVGPNTIGVVGPPGPAGRFAATFGPALPESGDIGLVTQSGGIAITASAALRRAGLGASAALSIGDAVDIGVPDALAWFDGHAGTAMVLLHDEGGEDLRGSVRATRHLARRVPVLALASGTSTAGSRAAASHTARAATPAAVREAVWTAGGVLGFDDMTTMVASAAVLRGQPLPEGRRTAVLTNVGGTGVLVADALAAAGLTVDRFPDGLRRRLASILPELATTTNPVDTGAVVTSAQFADALRCLMEASVVDAVVTVTVATAAGDPHEGVAAGVSTSGRHVPVVDVRPSRGTAVERIDLPRDGFVVSVQEPATAATALGAAVRRRTWLHREPGFPLVPTGVDFASAHAAVSAAVRRDPDGWLEPVDVAMLCTAAGLHPVETVVVRTPDEARVAASRLAGPVVVKGVVAGVVHKADAGLLRMPVTDPVEVARIVAEWTARWEDGWRGAVVQPLVAPGDELLVGAVRHPSAGPVVAVGPGGRAADALGHRVHRLAPLTAAEAEDMVRATGLFDTEHGRGLDHEAVQDCLHRVGWLLDVLPGLAEVEVNPLVVRRRGAVVIDVRMRVAPGG